jgi:HK97 family phage major capsid protein
VGGTTDAGGLQLPTHVDPTLIQPDKDFLGSIRPYCRNVTLPSGARTWNGVSATSGAIEWLGPDVDPVTREATEIDPTQTAVSVATNLAVAYMTASIEYDQDVGGGANVARVFDNARAREESTVFVTGSGTNRPTGIVTALDAVTTSEVDTDTTLVLDADDVNDLLYSELPVGYHDSARWLMHPAILAHIQGLETNVVLTNRGNLPRDANLGRDILGRPVHLTGAMDSSTNPLVINEQVIVLGDFMAYIIVDRMAPELVFLGHQYGANQRPTGHVGWALFYRQGGGIGSTTTGVGAPANALRLLSIL